MVKPSSQAPVSKHRPSYFTPKIKFTPNEDQLLFDAVMALGTSNWHAVAEKVPGRNSRQCRERWTNYVNPELVAAPWTDDEDKILLAKYEELGPKWHTIASFFATRSTNNIKNRFVTLQRRQKKKNQKKGRRSNKASLNTQSNMADMNENTSLLESLKQQESVQTSEECSESTTSNVTSDSSSDNEGKEDEEDMFKFLDILKETNEIFWASPFEPIPNDWLTLTF